MGFAISLIFPSRNSDGTRNSRNSPFIFIPHASTAFIKEQWHIHLNSMGAVVSIHGVRDVFKVLQKVMVFKKKKKAGLLD